MNSTKSSYPIFEKSQVLTSSHLNSIVRHFEEEDHLTRSKLIGIGILCGLEVKRHSDGTLGISKGIGITSEGYVIHIPDFVANHYRKYHLEQYQVRYSVFEDDSGEQDIELLELLDKPEDDLGNSAISLNTLNVSNYYVLLFLECQDREADSCLGNDCDQKGYTRNIQIRKLLISRPHLERVLTRSANVP
ncbi:MAG: hypothetical protein OEW87_10570, partial [Flavobacteriaceae bacterium]|nr:hypothetical protein [Flavobacteriaceae bacterium]